MGGAACGVVLPLIFTPAELIKCKKQVLPQQSNFSILKHLAQVIEMEVTAGLRMCL